MQASRSRHRTSKISRSSRPRTGLPLKLASCHTSLAGGYVLEGHIPAEVVERVLRERPKVAGLAVPGMPVGSPGMEQGSRRDPYRHCRVRQTGEDLNLRIATVAFQFSSVVKPVRLQVDVHAPITSLLRHDFRNTEKRHVRLCLYRAPFRVRVGSQGGVCVMSRTMLMVVGMLCVAAWPAAQAPANNANSGTRSNQRGSQTAQAEIKDPTGRVVGRATLTQTTHGVRIQSTFSGLPAGAHGFHIHETGQCEPPFTTSGGHFNPEPKQHGRENRMGRHAGDLPNLTVPENGRLIVDVVEPMVSLHSGPNSLMDETARRWSFTSDATTTRPILMATPALESHVESSRTSGMPKSFSPRRSQRSQSSFGFSSLCALWPLW